MRLLLGALGTVLRKELLDGGRDRRSIVSALVPLALVPLMLFVGFQAAARRIERERDIAVPVAGAAYGRALVEWLDRQAGIEIEPGPDEPRAHVREGRSDLVLVIPEEFAERFQGSRIAEVRIVVDGSDQGADRAADRLHRLIESYGQSIAQRRLIVRGVSPQVVRPLRVRRVDLATRRERAALAFQFIPMLLLMAAFVGGLQIAIDSTAGERERGSLEPLLVNPAPRIAIVGGKWLAASAFALASTGLTTAMILLVLEYSPLQRHGLALVLGLREVGWLLAASLPAGLLATAAQMAISTLARSYKEAQTYVSFLVFLPMLPMMLTLGSPVESTPWKLAVPVLAQHVLAIEILEGQPMDPLSFAVAGLMAAGGGLVFAALTAHLFRRERIVFGR